MYTASTPLGVLFCKKLASDQPQSLLHYLRPVGGKFVLCCNYDLKKLPIKLPPFYEECLKSFAKCSATNYESLQEIKDLSKTILWNKKFICVEGKSVYFKELVDKGILRMRDLITDNNALILKSNCKLRKLNISPLDVFRLVTLIVALPVEWRESLKTFVYMGDEPFSMHDEIKVTLNGQNVLIKTVVSKSVYKELRDRIITPATAQLNFNARFINDVLEWKEIYALPFRVALDTKLREFQYKLLNRCLVTNILLYKINVVPSQACSFCGEMDEYLEHFFVYCHYLNFFRAEVIKWLDDPDIKIEQLSDKDIMFGILKCEDELFVNHILLVAKQYLYSCRKSKSLPLISKLKNYIDLPNRGNDIKIKQVISSR